jgi:sarcosine oxidase subunit alpha
MDKPFFVGQRSLRVIARQPRKQKLVGFMLEPGFTGSAPQESHLVIHQAEMAGRVTSIGFSAAVGRHIGMAFVAPELAAVDSPISIRLSDGSEVRATVARTPFYDPDNLRQKETA